MSLATNNLNLEYSATRTFAASRTRMGYTITPLTGTTTVTVGVGGAAKAIPVGTEYVERNQDAAQFTVTTDGTYQVVTNDHTEA